MINYTKPYTYWHIDGLLCGLCYKGYNVTGYSSDNFYDKAGERIFGLTLGYNVFRSASGFNKVIRSIKSAKVRGY